MQSAQWILRLGKRTKHHHLLIGYFGIGKCSLAKALAELEPCKIVGNYHVLNPIFSLLEQDGITHCHP
jgi:MoxR-like ATPase